ncbi:MAG: hypothetical protein SPI25_05640 [Dialister sp.]|nr:hypothetical protein [Dialister sp.]
MRKTAELFLNVEEAPMADLPNELLRGLQNLNPELYEMLGKEKKAVPVSARQARKPVEPVFDSLREENNAEKVSELAAAAVDAVRRIVKKGRP